MTRHQLVEHIFRKGSYLCVGLDTDIAKIPRHLLSNADPVFQFNKQIIDATKDLCVSYKINTAFYEAMGVKGWESLERTVNYLPQEHFKIADAKRGDIGNTSSQYAKAFFESLNFDAVTVAPYMGEDSVKPFLDYRDKWAIVLGLTSNAGAKDFELQRFTRPARVDFRRRRWRALHHPSCGQRGVNRSGSELAVRCSSFADAALRRARSDKLRSDRSGDRFETTRHATALSDSTVG